MEEDSFEYRRHASDINSLDPLWIEFYSEFAKRKGSELEFIEFNSEHSIKSLPDNYPFPHNRLKFNYNAEFQLKGFDKRISFQDGRSFIIEEKVRYAPYNDVFVERWEDKHIWKVGWGWDTKMICEYLAYLPMLSGLRHYVFL